MVRSCKMKISDSYGGCSRFFREEDLNVTMLRHRVLFFRVLHFDRVCWGFLAYRLEK